MPSTYSDLLRLTKQATGENSGTWGGILNDNTIEMLEDAVAKVAEIDVSGSGDYTLTTANGSADEARCAVLLFTGLPTANRNIIIPASAKTYIVHNAASAAYTMTIKVGVGASVALAQNKMAVIYTDGTDVYQVTSIAAGSIETAMLADDAVTAAKIADDTVSNALMANMATNRIKGRTTSGTGDPEDLTPTQVTAMLDAMVGDSGSGGTKGLVPAPSSGDAAAGKVLKADGTWGGGSKVLGRGFASTASVITSTTAIPYDTSIPQSSEGTEALTLAYTPVKSGSKLTVRCEGMMTPTGGSHGMFALFRNSETDAVASSVGHNANIPNFEIPLTLQYGMTTSSTSAITFKLRFGINGVATTYLNGDETGAQFHGGVCATTMEVVEYDV